MHYVHSGFAHQFLSFSDIYISSKLNYLTNLLIPSKISIYPSASIPLYVPLGNGYLYLALFQDVCIRHTVEKIIAIYNEEYESDM